MSRYPVTNVLNILTLVRTIGVALGKETVKSGVHPGALTAVLEAPGFQEQLKTAMASVMLVDQEVKDLDLGECFELGRAAIETVKEIVEAFKAA